MSEFFNTFVSVVHGQAHTSLAFETIDLGPLFLAALPSEHNFKRSRFLDNKIGSFVLISEGVSADDDGMFPSGDQSGDVLDDDGLSEDGAVEDVADGAVGTLPHLFEFELLDPGLVGGDGGALHAHLVQFDCFCGFDRNSIFSRISVLDAEVVVLDVEGEEGEDELLLDGVPDDARHFIPVHLDHRALHLNLLHSFIYQLRSGFYLFVGCAFQQLSDGLVAVVLQGGVVAQDFVGDVLGDLGVDACAGFLVAGGEFVPFGLLFLALEFFDSFGCALAGHGLSTGLLADSAQNVVFFFFGVFLSFLAFSFDHLLSLLLPVFLLFDLLHLVAQFHEDVLHFVV